MNSSEFVENVAAPFALHPKDMFVWLPVSSIVLHTKDKFVVSRLKFVISHQSSMAKENMTKHVHQLFQGLCEKQTNKKALTKLRCATRVDGR